jgi:hypothetical protein
MITTGLTDPCTLQPYKQIRHGTTHHYNYWHNSIPAIVNITKS